MFDGLLVLVQHSVFLFRWGFRTKDRSDRAGSCEEDTTRADASRNARPDVCCDVRGVWLPAADSLACLPSFESPPPLFFTWQDVHFCEKDADGEGCPPAGHHSGLTPHTLLRIFSPLPLSGAELILPSPSLLSGSQWSMFVSADRRLAGKAAGLRGFPETQKAKPSRMISIAMFLLPLVSLFLSSKPSTCAIVQLHPAVVCLLAVRQCSSHCFVVDPFSIS